VFIRAARVSQEDCAARHARTVGSLPTPADHRQAQKMQTSAADVGWWLAVGKQAVTLLPSALRPNSSSSSSISSATARRLTWGTALGSCRYPVSRLRLLGFARSPTEYAMVRMVNAMGLGGCLESDLATDKEVCNSSLSQFIVTSIPAKRWERHYSD